MKVPRLGAELELQLLAYTTAIATRDPSYTTVHGNARSLTHWVRPEIEPKSSWMLVRFVNTEPQRELRSRNSNLICLHFELTLLTFTYILVGANKAKEIVVLLLLLWTYFSHQMAGMTWKADSITMAIILLQNIKFILHVSIFFFDYACGMWKFLGQGSNLCHSSNQCHSSDNAKSLTTWPPGNFHVSISWMPVAVLWAMLRGVLPFYDVLRLKF